MNVKNLTPFIIPLLLSVTLSAQPTNPLDYFPHQMGDHWEYRDANDFSLVEVLTVKKDSTDSLGNSFVKFGHDNSIYWHSTLRIDTLFNVYGWFTNPGQNGYLFYELDARMGESWVFWDDSVTSPIVAEVTDIFEGTLFNTIQTTFKEINYWIVTSPVDSFWIWTRYLAKDFGLVDWYFETGGRFFLAGAVIDSVRFGWLNPIDEPDKPAIASFELYQNYPNPFNPTTNLKFRIAEFGEVNLTIYDILGQPVKTLLNQKMAPGSYIIQWDGKDNLGNGVASGTYVYNLRQNRQALGGTMTLLR